MKRKLSLAELAEVKRRRYNCDYKRLMVEPPRVGRRHGWGMSLFEQYERQSALR